ncbi:MAG: CPBP family intramembrane metalloprotease [Bacteroidales bacterium]|nr:CPBP family intramembrane metalloprotease [Clostridium sp.]MCM1204190.1 CPBP family intramembrane metalloprotease [Bacteroidales bacterium]
MELEEVKAAGAADGQSTKKEMKNAGLFFFLLLLIEVPVSVFVVIIQGLFPDNYSTLISILLTQGYLLLGAVVFMLVTKKKLGRDLQVRKYRVSSFFLSLVVLITAAPMATWLNVFSQLFAKNETSGAVFQVTQNVPAWLGILIIGCLPGFIEETLYRGIMYSAFRKRSVLTGIVVSALSFGLMHLNFNQMMYAAYLGIVFALVVEATGSLASTMILHMLFNAVNTAYVYILPKLYEFLGQFYAEYANIDMEEVMNTTASNSQLIPMLVLVTPFAVGGIVLTVLLIKAIAKINGRQMTWAYLCGSEEEKKKTSPVNVFLLLGWGICLVISVLNLLA